MLQYIIVFFQALVLVKSDPIDLRLPLCYNEDVNDFSPPGYPNDLTCQSAPRDGETLAQFFQNLPMLESGSNRSTNRPLSDMAPSLKGLFLEYGNGDYIFEQNVFDSLPKLMQLLVAANNAITPAVYRLKIPPGAFENTPNLRRLYISNLILEPETYQAIRSAKDRLNELRLSDTSNQILDVLSEFTNLTWVELRSNNLALQISWPKVSVFTKSASTLETIKLYGFHIPKITKKLFFEGLPNLKYLNLVRCNVTSIDADAFNNMINLRELDLWGNEELGTLPAGVFDRLTKLRNIQFDERAKIGNLTRNNFTHVENFNRFTLAISPSKRVDIN